MAKIPKVESSVVTAILQEIHDARRAAFTASRAASKAQDKANAADSRLRQAEDAWRTLPRTFLERSKGK